MRTGWRSAAIRGTFLQKAELLFAAAGALTTLQLRRVKGRVLELASSPHLARLWELNLRVNGLTPEKLEKLRNEFEPGFLL